MSLKYQLSNRHIESMSVPKHSWCPTGAINEFYCLNCGIKRKLIGKIKKYFFNNEEIIQTGCKNKKV